MRVSLVLSMIDEVHLLQLSRRLVLVVTTSSFESAAFEQDLLII